MKEGRDRTFGNTDRTGGGVGGKPQCDCNCHQPPIISFPKDLSAWAQHELTRRLRGISAKALKDHPVAIQCIMRSVVFRDKHTVHPSKPWPKPVFISEEQNEENRLRGLV